MKDIPLIGIDDAAFELFSQERVSVFSVVMKGADHIEGIIETEIMIDSIDPTSNIISMIKRSDHQKHLQVILHEGVTIGGFGIIELERIFNELRIPIICTTKEKPDLTNIRQTIEENLSQSEIRIKQVENLPSPKKHPSKEIYFQGIGIEDQKATEIIDISIREGLTPEACRIAHLIGKSKFEYRQYLTQESEPSD